MVNSDRAPLLLNAKVPERGELLRTYPDPNLANDNALILSPSNARCGVVNLFEGTRSLRVLRRQSSFQAGVFSTHALDPRLAYNEALNSLFVQYCLDLGYFLQGNAI